MYTVVLFTITRTWRQPKCLADEWIKKMWSLYIMKYYSTIKNRKIMPFAAIWIQPEIITLSEVSQKEKDKYHIILLICGI